jgi:cytochrome c551
MTFYSAALLLLAAAAISGCSNGGAKQDNMASSGPGAHVTSAPELVQSVYKTNCMSCHGNNLEGRVGPKTNLQQVGARLDKDKLLKQIQNGGNGMPAFASKLKPEEAAALAEWLASKK